MHASVTIPTGGSSHTSPEVQQAKIDKLQASDTSPHTTHTGTTETSASPVNNDKYANGQATVSSGNNEIPTKNGVPVLHVSASGNNDGSYDLGTIDVTYTSLPNGYEWVADLPSYTYEAFTYTNVGGAVDVGYQWYNGDIGGYSAGAQFGAAILFGGAGAKAAKYGFSSFGEARRLYKEWGVGSFDTAGENIRYHVSYRGNGNYAKYMRQASNFNKRGAHSSGLRDDGSILYKRRDGEFLIERDGSIVTYGRN